MSELSESIIKSLMEFDFGNYGLDDVEFTKEDTATTEWVYDLAHNIERDWCNYVDGV